MTLNENSPWMTVLICLLAVLFTVVGGVVTFLHPDTLSFDDYLTRTGQLALAVAALGVGRSLKKGLIRQAGKQVAPSFFERAPITTITVGLMVLIAAVAGGIVTIADPTTLSFADYLAKMNTFAFAVGLQGAARALRKGLEARGPAPGTLDADIGPASAVDAGFQAHPDHPGNPAALGVAQPAPGPLAVDELTLIEQDDSFVDPADRAAIDDDLGAEDEPVEEPEDGAGETPAGTVAVDDLDARGDDVDASGDDDLGAVRDEDLPSDAEEDAAPPPFAPGEDPALLTDAHLLDEPDEPNVQMPSQDLR